MGNSGLTRRNSVFFLGKQDSSSSDKTERRLTISSRQNTLQEEVTTTVKKAAPFPEPLTDRQKQLLAETWAILEQDIASVGVITFIRYVAFAILTCGKVVMVVKVARCKLILKGRYFSSIISFYSLVNANSNVEHTINTASLTNTISSTVIHLYH